MFLKFNLGEIPVVNFVGRVKYKRPWVHFERVSSEHIMFLIEDGDLYIEEEGVRYHLQEGDCLILESGKYHIGYKAATCDYYFIHFESSTLEHVQEDDKAMDYLILNNKTVVFHDELPYSHHNTYIPKYISIKDSNVLYKLKNCFKSAVDNYYGSEDNYPVVCSSRLVEMLIIISRYIINEKKISYSKNISKTFFTAQELKKFLDTNSYRNITKEHIEEKFDLNYDYLNRLLKKYYGFSIQQYSQMKKIEKAKEILMNNDIKISVVGYLVGIDSPYYFSKLFKKHVGMSPLEYYKEVRLK